MARPSEPEKRLDLARHAVEVLQREGVDAPMSRIADAMGMNRSTLLYHFPTRSRIVETALEALLLEQAVFVSARVEQHEHPIDRLYAQMCAVCEFHRGREGRVVFLTQAIAASGARMADIVAFGSTVFEANRRAAATRIRQGIDEGVVAPCDPEALISLVRAVIDGLMIQHVMAALDVGPVLELVWAQLLRPLKKEPERT